MGPTNSGYNWGSTAQWSKLAANNQNSSNTISDTSSTIPSTNSPLPETRRDMISRLYKTILGREADSAGLNYYLFNTSISEAEISKQMFESTEHLEILTKAKDVREVIIKLKEANQKISELERKLESSEQLCLSYKDLLEQGKSVSQPTSDYIPENHIENTSYDIQNPTSNQNFNPDNTYQENESTYLNDPFAEDEKSGIFGKVKNIFRK